MIIGGSDIGSVENSNDLRNHQDVSSKPHKPVGIVAMTIRAVARGVEALNGGVLFGNGKDKLPRTSWTGGSVFLGPAPLDISLVAPT